MKVDVPKYIITDTGRAFLVLATDIYGNWNAGYHQWTGDNEDGMGTYEIVGTFIENGKDPYDAMKKLKEAMDANA